MSDNHITFSVHLYMERGAIRVSTGANKRVINIYTMITEQSRRMESYFKHKYYDETVLRNDIAVVKVNEI